MLSKIFHYLWILIIQLLFMFKKILLLASTSSVFATMYAVHTDNLQIEIDNPTFKSAFRFLHQKNPNYSKEIFKKLLVYQILSNKNKQLWENRVVKHGFDMQGDLLLGLKKLGLGGVEIGPTSFSASPQQYEGDFYLGLNYVRANMITIKQGMRLNTLNGSQKGQKQFKIGINIAPDYQVTKFTPYILKENILNCMQLITEDSSLFDFVVLNFDERNQRAYIETIPLQHPQIINQITSQSRKMLEACEQGVKIKKLYLQVSEKAKDKFLKNKTVDQVISINENGSIQFTDKSKQNCISFIDYDEIIKKILEN